ncbi:peptidoglycan-binding protein [Labrenzia sp. PHM005]|uniref:peptidoglycan-binding protein n=1 Tax=Labrenzia sp. PHM005 TaxID=2590016 RepID=UPI0011403F02|nr:peptidoglycan-binding protein [Labrenzia sp. PHM005]QDG76396.1 hypothetical protein FJ695_11225 [Labrenzia sp. PHM005]
MRLFRPTGPHHNVQAAVLAVLFLAASFQPAGAHVLKEREFVLQPKLSDGFERMKPILDRLRQLQEQAGDAPPSPDRPPTAQPAAPISPAPSVPAGSTSPPAPPAEQSPATIPAAPAHGLVGLSGQETEVLNTYNKATVRSGPSVSPQVTLRVPTLITQLQTYHWNNGTGTAQAGAIGIAGIGFWQAVGAPGMNNAPNVEWIARPNLVLNPGTYVIIDSAPATWATNDNANNVGFVVVRGIPIGMPPAQATAPTVAAMPPAPADQVAPSAPLEAPQAVAPPPPLPSQPAPVPEPPTQHAGNGEPGIEVDKNTLLAIQALLNRLGYLADKPTGTISGNTGTAISRFQNDNGLPADGLPTQDLRDALISAVKEPQKTKGGAKPKADGNGSQTVKAPPAAPGPYAHTEDEVGDFASSLNATRGIFKSRPNGWLASGTMPVGDVDVILFATSKQGDVQVTIRPCTRQAEMIVVNDAGQELVRADDISYGYYGLYTTRKLTNLPKGLYAVMLKHTGRTPCEDEAQGWNAEVAGHIIVP